MKQTQDFPISIGFILFFFKHFLTEQQYKMSTQLDLSTMTGLHMSALQSEKKNVRKETPNC